AGQQGGHAGDVAVLLPGPVAVAEDHVADGRRVQGRVAGQQLAQDVGGQVVGAGAGQGPAVAPDRRPDGVENEHLSGHAMLPSRAQRPAPPCCPPPMMPQGRTLAEGRALGLWITWAGAATVRGRPLPQVTGTGPGRGGQRLGCPQRWRQTTASLACTGCRRASSWPPVTSWPAGSGPPATGRRAAGGGACGAPPSAPGRPTTRP